MGGGSSLYESMLGGNKADVVSFDRPTQSHFNHWEYYYVVWVEQFARKHNLKIDYATNHDFYKDPSFADGYTLLVSLGHDEYWSQEEFNAHYNRIFKQGKNVMFLGANTAYWRIRYGDLHNSGEGRQLVCYRYGLKDEDDIENALFDPIGYTDKGMSNSTGLFRGKIGYPGTMLMGVGFQGWFADKNLRFSYKVASIIPWIFEGTDLKQGDEVAEVIGYEWDNTSLVFRGISIWSEKKSYIPNLDRENLEVIFEGDVINNRGEKGYAQAVYFESSAGAKVFSAGTIRWAWGVSKPGFVNEQFKKINENLIIGLLETNTNN